MISSDKINRAQRQKMYAVFNNKPMDNNSSIFLHCRTLFLCEQFLDVSVSDGKTKRQYRRRRRGGYFLLYKGLLFIFASHILYENMNILWYSDCKPGRFGSKKILYGGSPTIISKLAGKAFSYLWVKSFYVHR